MKRTISTAISRQGPDPENPLKWLHFSTRGCAEMTTRVDASLLQGLEHSWVSRRPPHPCRLKDPAAQDTCYPPLTTSLAQLLIAKKWLEVVRSICVYLWQHSFLAFQTEFRAEMYKFTNKSSAFKKMVWITAYLCIVPLDLVFVAY